MTTIHTRHLKIQHVQKLYSRPVSKRCPFVIYKKIVARLFALQGDSNNCGYDNVGDADDLW